MALNEKSNTTSNRETNCSLTDKERDAILMAIEMLTQDEEGYEYLDMTEQQVEQLKAKITSKGIIRDVT